MAVKGGKAGYHHGDLRNALTEAAVELAAEGGPERVVLREAARRVGVSPTAAYRHFGSHCDLLGAVKERCQRQLAASMARAVEEGPELPDAGEEAVRRTVAIGRGYVRFAVENPGLYRSAFSRVVLDGAAGDHGLVFAGVLPPGDDPVFRAFRALSDTLDALVESGRMRPGNRAGAEVAAWSTVHGLSLLILDGPLARLPEEQRDAVVDRSLEAIVAGLTR
ncbi:MULTISPECIES: TetR/AcrR family transcriptional regulator [Streptomyces]|uniref:TetR/AcrR family transcriptional regulator n=1 Tax=Streptomyces lycii TaxID=2654337 RepID=A0ABQ7FGD9_9ACTN|nr:MULTISPECIES: TetR/AcrR family transcriptional regulator [Streptomyces]KAF4406313.1 TetR/AcrR family transcriptional regulator [Streptomyces lycii]PGH47665.1 TetR family transcriptional regulator [Streptomyces sp. Ru87]